MSRPVPVVLLLLSLALPGSADGMFAGKAAPRAASSELAAVTPRQHAVLIRRADGRELLILQPTYRGPAGDFAWVIPLPSLPAREDVALASADFVAASFAATEPAVKTIIHEPTPPGEYRYASGGMTAPPPPPSAPGAAPAPPGDVVTVHERFRVGKYSAVTLSATDPTALERWLRTNGYHVPAGLDQALASYVQRKWYFVALKLSAKSSGGQVTSRDLDPLALSFVSDRLVYPLTLTRLASAPRLSLLLLVVDSRFTKCTTLPTVGIHESLPKGSTYGTVRRRLAEKYRQGCLLREAVTEGTTRSGNFYGPLAEIASQANGADGTLRLKSVRDWQHCGASRFFALLPREQLQDLYFEPDPAARQFHLRVTREGWARLPLWFALMGPPVTAPALLVLAVLLLLLNARRQPPAPERPVSTWPAWVWLALVAGLVVFYRLAAEGLGDTLLPLLFPLGPEPYDQPEFLAALLLQGFLLAAFAELAFELWRRVSYRRSPWAHRFAVLLGLLAFAGGGFVTLNPLHLNFGAATLQILCALWLAALVSSAPLALVLLRSARRGWSPALVVVVLLVALTGSAGLDQARWSRGKWRPAADVLGGSQYTLQSAADAFTSSRGAYPLSVADLLPDAKPRQGQDASGNPVPLTGRQKAFLKSPVTDPLTGRADTWIVDPLSPELISSGGFRVEAAPEGSP